MTNDDSKPRITEEDVEGRPLKRRSFLRRFGAAAGLAGLVGFTTACDPEGGSSDTDSTDAESSDSDATEAPASDADASDSDSGSP